MTRGRGVPATLLVGATAIFLVLVALTALSTAHAQTEAAADGDLAAAGGGDANGHGHPIAQEGVDNNGQHLETHQERYSPSHAAATPELQHQEPDTSADSDGWTAADSDMDSATRAPGDLVHAAAGVFIPPTPELQDLNASASLTDSEGDERDADRQPTRTMTEGESIGHVEDAAQQATEGEGGGSREPVRESEEEEEEEEEADRVGGDGDVPQLPLEAAPGPEGAPAAVAEHPAAVALDSDPLAEEQNPGRPEGYASLDTRMEREMAEVRGEDETPVERSVADDTGQTNEPAVAEEMMAHEEGEQVATRDDVVFRADADDMTTAAGSEPRRTPGSRSFRPDVEMLSTMRTRTTDPPHTAAAASAYGSGEDVSGDHGDGTGAQAHAYTELARFLPFFRGAGVAASGEALAECYYHAMEALYVHHNTSAFAKRVAAGVATTGHGRLHLILGTLYAHGLGVVRSEAKAVLHYTFAAVQGIPEAHVVLGQRHSSGHGVVQSCSASAMHLREAADAVAMTYDGKLGPRRGHTLAYAAATAEEGEDSFALFAPTGDGSSSSSSGGGGGRGGSHSQRMTAIDTRRVEALHMAVDRGSAYAAMQLGIAYVHGNHALRRDLRAAERYFLKAIQLASANKDDSTLNVALVYAHLGMLYLTGDAHARPMPLPRDFAAALTYLRNSTALAANPTAANGLGYLHAIGYLRDGKTLDERHADPAYNPHDSEDSGATPDFASAAKYFESAAGAGSVEARYNLGVLHLHGRGVPLDVALAQRLFQDAARSRSVLALWQLGILAETQGDCGRAVEYYMRVSRYGSWLDTEGPATDPVVVVHRGGSGSKGGSSSSGGVRRGAPSTTTTSVRADQDPQSGEGAEKEPPSPLAVQRRMLARLRQSVAEASLTRKGKMPRSEHGHAASMHSSGGGSGVRGLFGFASGSPSVDTAPVVRFVESLALAEMGTVAAIHDAAELLDDTIHVAGEGTPAETLLFDGLVEADNPSFARGNRLPQHAVEEVDADTVVLQWMLPTVVRFQRRREGNSKGKAQDGDEGEGAAVAVPWLLSQHEAKRLLLLRLLRINAAHSNAACLRLGNFYYYGESPLVGSDAAMALHYYRIAASRGNSPKAFFNVGIMCQLGIGVPVPASALPATPSEASARPRGMGASVVSMNPVTRPWVPSRASSAALVAAHTARIQAAPNYVLEGLIRMLEGTVHTTAPLSRAWRYEGAGAWGTKAAAYDLLAAAAWPAPTATAGTTTEAGVALSCHRPAYYHYDLHLAKRAFDSCLYHSRGGAYFVVWLALSMLNVQWWALYFGRDVARGVVMHAVAKLSAAAAAASGVSEAGVVHAGGPLALAKALLEGAMTELTLAVLGAGDPSMDGGSSSIGTDRAGNGVTLALRAVARYEQMESYVLYALCGLLFATLLILHVAQ